jgi:hypothetical protein
VSAHGLGHGSPVSGLKKDGRGSGRKKIPAERSPDPSQHPASPTPTYHVLAHLFGTVRGLNSGNQAQGMFLLRILVCLNATVSSWF